MSDKENIQDEELESQNEEMTFEENTEEVVAEQLSPEEELEAKAKEATDKYLRLYSEFDNFRKRTQKEKN